MTTETLRFALVALSLVALTCLASDPKFATDQYLARHDQSHPFRPLDEALKVLESRHRFDLKQKKSQNEYPLNNDIVPDLQVGCGDGLLVETTTPKPAIPEYKKVFARKERRKRETNERKPRDYFSYTIYSPSSVSYSIWKSQQYKTGRPYFIPILGSQGRIPIYFPPQPVYVNPGFPLDNPPKKGYVPPPTQPTTTTKPLITLDSRFGGEEPVWGMRPAESSATARPSGTTTTSTFPPLIHNINPESGAELLTTTRQPAFIELAPVDELFSNDFNSFRPGRPAAPVPVPVASTPRPTVPSPSAPSPTAANPCVWAIINCCSASSSGISNSCFARFGCPGPFWDRSPCDSDFAKEATRMALNFYEDRLD